MNLPNRHEFEEPDPLGSLKTLTFWAVVGFLLYWVARRAPKTVGFVVGLLGGLWVLSGALIKSPWGV
jgi:CHASE2 domain-containing sensor protein